MLIMPQAQAMQPFILRFLLVMSARWVTYRAYTFDKANNPHRSQSVIQRDKLLMHEHIIQLWISSIILLFVVFISPSSSSAAAAVLPLTAGKPGEVWSKWQTSPKTWRSKKTQRTTLTSNSAAPSLAAASAAAITPSYWEYCSSAPKRLKSPAKTTGNRHTGQFSVVLAKQPVSIVIMWWW